MVVYLCVDTIHYLLFLYNILCRTRFYYMSDRFFSAPDKKGNRDNFEIIFIFIRKIF